MNVGELITAFFTVPGPGGVVVITVIGGAALTYTLLTRWILRGDQDEDNI